LRGGRRLLCRDFGEASQIVEQTDSGAADCFCHVAVLEWFEFDLRSLALAIDADRMRANSTAHAIGVDGMHSIRFFIAGHGRASCCKEQSGSRRQTRFRSTIRLSDADSLVEWRRSVAGYSPGAAAESMVWAAGLVSKETFDPARAPCRTLPPTGVTLGVRCDSNASNFLLNPCIANGSSGH